MAPDNLPARYQAPATMDLSKPLTDLAEALQLADTLSRSSLVPTSMTGKAASIFHVLMTGQALDLHWTESIRVIYSAGPGQIGMRGSFLLSRLRKAGHTYSLTEGDDYCEFKLVRGDTKEEFTSRFTIDDAIRGGLLQRERDGTLTAKSREGKPLPWQAWTKRMLRWRAVSDCVSFGAPEVALGFEIEGDVPEPEPQREVQLTPQAQPEPASEPASRAHLAAMSEAAQPPAQPEVGGNAADPTPAQAPVSPAASGTPTASQAQPSAATATADGPAPVEGTGRRAVEKQLADLFIELGWNPAKYRGEMLRACSMFAGRKIANVRELQVNEMFGMIKQLSELASKHEPEHQVVAMADLVEAWAESFRRTDPDGFERTGYK